MSGGFFRGTSADQDTRFSNKQAKLLKSQKFAPELEQLVDMTKVKMDVMRPWIATRVTELIGFEDEVLINFIYGLLDGKEVNGKEVQISLTGFMERNTGKFMKELWSLLLSAQNNASGVPQQFLDAKEEETKKKKAESDRIANEIWRKKEKESQELEQERTKQMDHGNDVMKDVDTDLQPNSKYQPRARSLEEKKSEERNGLQGRSRFSKSPHSADHSSSPRRRSRSLSASPKQRGRSSSSDMVQRYSPRYSLSPRRRNSSRRSFTPRRRSSHSRRRSLSRSHRRSPSPIRYRKRSPLHRSSRSPPRDRSRSPIWCRPRSPTRRSSPRDLSESPIRRRSSSVRHRSPPLTRRRSPPLTRRRSPSPTRYRSPSPMRPPSPMRRKYRRSSSTPRRRSPPPIRRRSPPPIRRRSPSPIRRRSRSPIRRRSPRIRRRSPSPFYRLSPSPIGRRSPIAGRQRSPSPANDRSPSPQVSSSPSPPRSSRSPVRSISPRRQRKSPLQSPRGRIRRHEKHSPGHRSTPSDTVEHRIAARQRSHSSESRSRSTSWNRNDSHIKVKRSPISPHGSPSVSEAEKEMNLIEKRREKIAHCESPNPGKKARENKHGSFEMSVDDKETNEFREAAKRKHNSSGKVSSSDQHKGLHGKGQNKDDPVQTQGRADRIELNKTDEVLNRGNKSEKIDHQKTPGQQDSKISTNTFYSEKGRESPIGGHRAVEKIDDLHFEAARKLSRKVEQNAQSASIGSDSDESDKSRAKVKDKRKKKRAERHALESADESSYDSYAEERKEAKRRRKEEKRLKKEERRWRREERRRRKEERRAEKQKLKSIHAVSSSSDVDRNRDDRSDDEQHVQKKIEIELREKALESFRAKKGIGH